MKIFEKVIEIEKNVIDYLESSKIPFLYFILTFISVTSLRNFLEVFSDKSPFNPANFIHFYFSYVALAMSFILLFYVTTKTPIVKIAKVVLTSFIILNLVPVVDLILSLGKGFKITYLEPEFHSDLLLRFFTFFGDYASGAGVTPGMRIEIALVLIASLIYFYVKKHSLLKSMVNTLFVYVLIFIYIAAPFGVKLFVENFGLEYNYSQLLMFHFYLLVIFFLGIFLAYVANKKLFGVILRDIRPLRLFHYQLMFAFGVVLGLEVFSFDLNSQNLLVFVLAPISITFAWLFSVMTNNIVDLNIDRISNVTRPLVKNYVDPKKYMYLAWFFLTVSLFYAVAVNYDALFFIALFIGNYFMYSMPPLRLKRVPLFSKLLISINSLILIMFGFVTITGEIQEFPSIVTVIMLIGFTLAINFIDIKDYFGDKKEGIKTLPVILGLEKSKLVIGTFFVFAHLSIFFVTRDLTLISVIVLLGLVQFYLINKKDYDENKIFYVYFITLAVIFYGLFYQNSLGFF